MRFLTPAVLLIFSVSALQAVYHDTLRCFRIDSAAAPVMDGDMADWPAEYKAGTFKGEYNLFCVHPVGSWDMVSGFTNDYNAELYLAHTDSFFYVGWKTTVDDVVMQGSDAARASDRFLLTWSGSNRIFLFNDATPSGTNPMFDNAFNPAWIPNVRTGVKPGWGASDLPSYEVRLKKSDIGRTMLLIGYMFEDYDGSTNITRQLGIGCMYTGPHTGTECYSVSGWQDPTWFPITKLISTPPIGIETTRMVNGPLSFSAAPNPFNPSVTIDIGNTGITGAHVTVYDVQGRLVADLTDRMAGGRVVWDASDKTSGIYLVRLSVGTGTAVKTITLLK